MIDFISRLNRYLLVYHQQLKNCNTKKEIVERNHAIISDFINSLEVYEKSHCEGENKMNNAKRKDVFEPISEEFYRKLWKLMTPGDYILSLDETKSKGYIKHSREDEIRDKLKMVKTIKPSIDYISIDSFNSALELIEILDNQIKELRNQ